MKIVDFRIHPIAIADPPLRSSYGLHAPYALRSIIEIVSEDGIVGINETYGAESQINALNHIKSRVIGKDAFQISADLIGLFDDKPIDDDTSQTFLVPGENPSDTGSRAFAAVEVACLDLIGRSIGQPVCRLLGGQIRDLVPFSAYAFYKHAGGGGEGQDQREDEYGEAMTSDGIVNQVRQMVRQYGFGSIKLKGGVLEPELEIKTIQKLRESFGPEFPLRIDPNCAWSVQTSVRVGQELKAELSSGGYLEDPTSGLRSMGLVRKMLESKGIDTPLASNVAVTRFEDIPECIQFQSARIILCDHHYWGGMRRVQQLGRLCQTFNLGLSMHSNTHLGISLMAMAHVAAATPHLSYACDTHYPWQSAIDEVVAGGRIPFEEGNVRVSDKPGLGVELDLDQLARGKERFEKCPYRKRDDTTEMRKHVDPNWTRILPRW